MLQQQLRNILAVFGGNQFGNLFGCQHRVVARTLRQTIVDGKLNDGDFLPNEPELMSHFGVRHPTLREAVRVLELSAATIADVLVARSAIDPVAARLLACNGKAKASDELISTEDIPASLEGRASRRRIRRCPAGRWLRSVMACHVLDA
jgi:DNA-binding FadR family transcriptional regulator